MAVGDGDTVAEGDGVDVDEGVVARKEVILRTALLDICMRRPQKPEDKELSVFVTVQVLGSVPEVAHTLAYSEVPTTRKRML